jgi:NarL family two-component system response regulator YdfI
MEKVKVFLSDPQILFREGIHFILSGEEDFEVTGETTSNEEAFTLIEANPPNIAVLSMLDKKSTGPDTARRIKRSQSAVSIILTIDKKEDGAIFEALKSGASACLTKDSEAEQLLDIIRVVSQGSIPIMDELMTPGVAAIALAEFENLNALSEHMDNLLARLTQKETQVLDGLATGSSFEQVAVKMGINEDNLRRHLRQILNKLVTNDQSQIVIEAAQRGLPGIIRPPLKKDGKPVEYVTRAEFIEFKDKLMERLKSFLGELT